MLHGEERSRRAGGDADLVVDVLDVMVDGPFGDDELSGHLAVAETAREEPEHLHLPIAQAGWPLAARPSNPVARRSEHGVHGLAVEASSANFAAQLVCGLVRRERQAVWSWLGHGVVCIGRGEGAGGWW